MLRAAERLLGAGLFLSVLITLGGCGGTSATPAGAAALSPAPSGGASSNAGATGGTPGSGSGPVTSPPSNPTPGPQPTPTSVETIYVPVSGTSGTGASGYNIDPNSGQLKKIGDFSSGAVGFGAYSADPQNRIYISNNGPSDCYKGFCSMDTRFSTLVRNTVTGALKIGMDNVLVPKRFNGIAILPSAKFAYTVEWTDEDATSPKIRGFRIDVTTGTLTQIDIGEVPFGLWGPLFAHPKLPFLYAFEDRCCGVAPVTKLHVWSVDDNTGHVTELSTSPTILAKPAEFWPTISKDGSYFYGAMPLPLNSEIDVMRMDANGVPQSITLASITTQPFPDFNAFLVHPSGTIVYGWGWHHNADGTAKAAIHAYRLDARTNTFSDLDLTSKVPSIDLMPLGFDASGKHFYLGRSADLPFAVYNVDPDSGDLTLASYGVVN